MKRIYKELLPQNVAHIVMVCCVLTKSEEAEDVEDKRKIVDRPKDLSTINSIWKWFS